MINAQIDDNLKSQNSNQLTKYESQISWNSVVKNKHFAIFWTVLHWNTYTSDLNGSNTDLNSITCLQSFKIVKSGMLPDLF